jgi:hypothetical protein
MENMKMSQPIAEECYQQYISVLHDLMIAKIESAYRQKKNRSY